MAEKLSRTLFYIIIWFIPLNLGYHFIINDAYIGGLLIDYLIPTIYVQDILIVMLLGLNIPFLIKNTRKTDKYLIWFLFIVCLTSISSVFLVSSITSFARLLIYAGFMAVVKLRYSDKKTFENVVHIVGILVFFLSILAIAQWIKQGAVFNNYLLFGEQPYTSSTFGINVENYFGKARVPPYATFRHPNVFGGILSIVLVWFLFYIKDSKLLRVSYILGLIALFFTLSKFSWISFIIGVLYYLAYKKDNKMLKRGVIGAVVFILALSLLLPFMYGIKSISHRPSFYRRADLLDSSYKLIDKNTLFGIGYGASTAYIDKFLPPKHDVRFAQPPHNTFVLLFAESGILALMFFITFLIKKFIQTRNIKNNILFISLLQIVLLASFDHYFFTIHQPQLLFWLILGFI